MRRCFGVQIAARASDISPLQTVRNGSTSSYLQWIPGVKREADLSPTPRAEVHEWRYTSIPPYMPWWRVKGQLNILLTQTELTAVSTDSRKRFQFLNNQQSRLVAIRRSPCLQEEHTYAAADTSTAAGRVTKLPCFSFCARYWIHSWM